MDIIVEKEIEQGENYSVFHSVEFNKILKEVLNKKISYIKGNKYSLVVHPSRKFLLKINYCPDPRLECVYGGVLGRQEVIKNLNGLWHITTSPNADITEYIKNGFYAKERFTSILSLDESSKNLWNNLDKKTRKLVRKGQKSGIKIIVSKDFSEYYEILKDTYKKNNLRILPKEFYQEVINKLGKLFLVVYDNKIIAGASFLKFKDKVYHWNGCARSEYLNFAPNNLLQWKFIKWAKESGFGSYDLLGLDVPSIARFKEGFGGKRVRYYTLMSKPLYLLKKIKDLV